ncbi:hypothetical protein MRB53_003678 [Persea americana]|uniref:Uncharacterized protein n=1 Tax=Persea americana TaxID=3435 RepID=A0ACC2MYC9_PERAE|nr:hypothetical protein MRB53_003678 [Persea americana]
MDEEIEMGRVGDEALGRCIGHVEGEGDTFVESYGMKGEGNTFVESYGMKCWWYFAAAFSFAPRHTKHSKGKNPMPFFCY